MYYSGVFCLMGILLVVEFAEAATKAEVLIMQTVLCDEDMKEAGDLVENCFEQIEVPSKFENITMECCPGLEDRKNGSAIREWYCENQLQVILECSNCQEEKLKENGEEEYVKTMSGPLRECIKKSLLSL